MSTFLRTGRLLKSQLPKLKESYFLTSGVKRKDWTWLTDQEIDSISKDLGVKPSEVREMEKRLSGSDISFDPLSDSDDEEAVYSPSQYLQDESSNPEDILEKEIMTAESTTSLHKAINELDDRSRDILQDRWLADEKLTLHDLAEKYHISAERVRQIEKNAMKKVKQSLASS